jgi:C-terminal processing protease CtpA/Prc
MQTKSKEYYVKKIALTITTVVLLSSCQAFLGHDPGNNPRDIFERIWTDFDENYALFDVKGIKWDNVYGTFSPLVSSGMSEQQLFDVCANMLKTLNDAHVYIMSPFDFSNSGGRFDTVNNEPFSLEVVKKYLNNGGSSAGDGMFLYGTVLSKPSVGYIYIAGFASGSTGTAQTQDWTKAIDGIVQSLADTDSLVLDIRGNRGGLPANVDFIAGRFVSGQKDYVEVRTKNGPGRNDFSSPISNAIKPAGSRYTKPIVLLTNKQTISGGEWFTLALRTQNHITHAGGKTNGAFSLSLERSLINGWIYSVSVQKVTDMAGICYEGTGITPKYEVTNTVGEIASGKDTQLEYARDFF